MPSGVYERRSWMKNYGKTAGVREEIRARRAGGESLRSLARKFNVAWTTVKKIEDGEWNPGRMSARARGGKEPEDVCDGNCAS